MNEASGLWALVRLLLEALARAFFPALFAAAGEARRDTAEEAKPAPELRARLRERIRAAGWDKAALGFFFAAVVLLPVGCGTRSIYVPAGEPVRLRTTLKNVPVWVLDADGRPTSATLDLPEGWYCLPDPGPDGKANP